MVLNLEDEDYDDIFLSFFTLFLIDATLDTQKKEKKKKVEGVF